MRSGAKSSGLSARIEREMAQVFALCDCNNFYVSCERVFDARLVGRAVVVLSNNNGCVISRSEESKALGIRSAALRATPPTGESF